MLEQAIECTDNAEERIRVIDGLTSGPRREEVQRRFNADPAKDPLRILIATDAAREGVKAQRVNRWGWYTCGQRPTEWNGQRNGPRQGIAQSYKAINRIACLSAWSTDLEHTEPRAHAAG